MLPELHEDLDIVDHLCDGVDGALPDAAQITQVEDVVELGWGRQHLDL